MSADLVTINVTALRDLVAKLVDERLAERAAPVEYLSTADAARVAGVAQGTLRRWIREGKLTPHHAGRELRVERGELDRLMRGDSDGADLSPEALAARDFGR